MYILLLIMRFGPALQVTPIEFTSRSTCETAAKEIMAKPVPKYLQTDYICVEK